ncbi:MAG: hypothetical protein U7123_07220 [Potamolinea sp.]
MANQTRIVLDAGDRPKAEQILESTGIKTFSQLFAIFLVNYGDHLVKALKASPSAPPPPVIIPASASNLPTIAKPQRGVLPQHTPMNI